ncbi:MAG: radical SAM protein [candidate division WOR-3 bacterium]|nr:radical SAM protein [candidate division WOR-3 bacterium]
MKIIGKTGREDIAFVYIAQVRDGLFTEFVESVQPPIPREEKWVLIVSTLYGCPVRCKICDAGGTYKGKLSAEEIIEQIDFMVKNRYPDRKIPVKKFKIQFARIGEPSFNPAVLEVLDRLPRLYDAPGLMVCISTIAPEGTEKFFTEMLEIKKKYYHGKFQLQFSIHTTDKSLRDWLTPINKWNFKQISDYGEVFYQDGDRKIALNFALAENMPVDENVLLKYFNPEKFVIKITPVNPTFTAFENKIFSYVKNESEKYEVIERLKSAGYEVILSIGELEENKIGSNCGQYVYKYMKEKPEIKNSYTYPVLS